MPSAVQTTHFPELVFGVCGPIGVDTEAICDSLRAALVEVLYSTVDVVKLTREMYGYPQEVTPEGKSDYFSEIKTKIAFANNLRWTNSDYAALARIAMFSVRKKRHEKTGDSNKVAGRTAYLISQLKRPEEVDLLRKVYGKLFILVSAYAPEDQRLRLLELKIKASSSTRLTAHDIRCLADELIQTDANEHDNEFGQRLRETFHLGDVFIDGINRGEMDPKIRRFVQALFGRNDITPSKIEYGMYSAKSAALRPL